jgi:ATP-dependent RNA helicase SUPV3L1/SUV3
LRKYGVRFGAYHIYVPALLKPAARALASRLWAEKQSNVDLSALSGAQHLAGSGRTSFPVDKSLDRDAYRVLGYRQCGERAVRVDILERLADLIRPALAWREASPGTKPAGAFDGRGFVVTQAMTSLTGSAGEDFASILRALGYRMERKVPLPPKPVVVEAPAAEAAAAETPVDGGHVAPDSAASAPGSATLLPDVAFSTASEVAEQVAEPATVETAQPEPPAVVETPAVAEVVEAPAAEAPQEVQEQAAAESATETVAAVEAAAADTETAAAGDAAAADSAAAAPEVAATPEVAAAPEMVEVWRPGGRSEERRPRHDRSRQRHHDRPAQAGEPAAAVAGEAGEAAKGERHRRGRRDRNQDFRKPRTDAPPAEGGAAVAADGAPASPPREDRGARPPRERFEGKGRDGDKSQGRPPSKPQDKPQDKPRGKFGGGRDKGGRDRDKGGFGGKGGRDSGPSHRQFATTATPRDRDRPVDPNSPFAKLAALKEQLTANRKD